MAGTTIDDHGAVYEALREAAVSTGADCTTEQVELWMGADKRAALRGLAAIGGVELDEDEVESAYATFRDLLVKAYASNPPTAIDGVPAALAELRSRGVKVALTTGFAHDVADPLLSSLGWVPGGELIDAVVCVDEVAAGRPAPDLILLAMERTGVSDSSHVVAVGDTLFDLRAGRNAGVVSVGVGTGKLGLEGLAKEPHDYLLASVADLPRLVASVDAG